MTPSHQCPIKDCPLHVPHSKLMCVTHWRLVPRRLQQQLYRAYAVWRRDPGKDTYQAHQQAIQECVAAAQHALTDNDPED